MPRLVHPVTGVVVNVSDEKAESLGSGWAEFRPEAPKKATAKKASSAKKS